MESKPPFGMLAKLSGYVARREQTKPHYDEWSQTYDHDLLATYGYTGHTIAADAFAAATPDKSRAVIDVGCGTGLVGQELARLGFSNIDGTDISRNMLAEAEKKGIYARLISGDMMQGTSISDGAYDGAICVGSFGPGHLGPRCFREICRFVKPGGPIVLFLNAKSFIEDDHAGHIQRLENESVWKVTDIRALHYMTEVDRPGRLLTAHRC